jgi:hypothetical protein
MRTRAGVALVVVHAVAGHVLSVDMPVVQVVDVIGMHDRVVPTARAVGVTVCLGLAVLDSVISWSFRRYPLC